MNQSPPRALMRDQVDAREAVGVRNWLAYHQQHLQQSERRRVDNRLRAQDAFDQSQAELASLRRELDDSRRMAPIGVAPTPPSPPPVMRFSAPPQCMYSDDEPGMGDVSPISHPPRPLPQSSIVNESAVQDRPAVATGVEQPIGVVRDVNLLKEAIAERDATIDRLQARLRSDRSFYQAQIARARDDSDTATADSSAKIAGLRAQLEISLHQNRSHIHRSANDADGFAVGGESIAGEESSVLESKIAELHTMFHNTLDAMRSKTDQALQGYKGEVERRVAHVTAASEAAVKAAREVFRAERFESLTLSQEGLIMRLSRDHESALRSAEASVLASLSRTLGGEVAGCVDSCVRAELSGSVVPLLRDALAGDIRGQIAASVETSLESLVLEHAAGLSTHFAGQLAEAKQKLSHLAASYAGVDAKGIDHVLTVTQQEFRDLRHTTERAAHTQQLEHVAFMSRARLVLDRTEGVNRRADVYAQRRGGATSADEQLQGVLEAL